MNIYRKWYAFVLVVISLSRVQGQIALEFLHGTWTGQMANADVAILTEDGMSTICRDSLPPDCEAQVPSGFEQYIFNGTTLSQSYHHLEGINTREKSAELMPACAEADIYPIEFIIGIPPSEIVAYEFFSGHLTYVDSRRPGESDCVVVQYGLNDKGPYLAIDQMIGYDGSLENVFMMGPSFRCTNPPETCEVELENGSVHLAFRNAFTLTCTEGDCNTLSSFFRQKRNLP